MVLGSFHTIVLCVFALALTYGTMVLYAHAKALAEIIPLYPLARYAPEREAFEEKGVWVFVSPDSSEKISKYYTALAKQLGYQVTRDHDATRDRIYFSRAPLHLFLTISDEGGTRVLYYSEAGEVRTISVPVPRP